MATEVFDDLQGFIEAAKQASEWREINGADWNLEIPAIIEAASERIPQPPMLIFDQIKGYPKGYRVLGCAFSSHKRVALALGLPSDKSKLELARLASRKIRDAQPIPPREVSKGTTHCRAPGSSQGGDRGAIRSMDYISRREDEFMEYVQKEFNIDRRVAAPSYAILKRVLTIAGDIDEPVLKSLVDNMKQDVKVTEEVPPDRIVDLAPLREVQQELNIKRTK